jgi:hypothetical protein
LGALTADAFSDALGATLQLLAEAIVSNRAKDIRVFMPSPFHKEQNQ